MVIYDAESVEGIYAFIYCTKWSFGQVSGMPDKRTDGQTLKDRATQLLMKYKSGALVTQNVQDIIICYGRQNESWPISAIIFTSS